MGIESVMAELDAILETIPPADRIVVREGGGPVNLLASLAASVANLVQRANSAEAGLRFAKAKLDPFSGTGHAADPLYDRDAFIADTTLVDTAVPLEQARQFYESNRHGLTTGEPMEWPVTGPHPPVGLEMPATVDFKGMDAIMGLLSPALSVGESAAMCPMYKLNPHFPSSKSRAVASAPQIVSRHGNRTSGNTRKSIAKSAASRTTPKPRSPIWARASPTPPCATPTGACGRRSAWWAKHTGCGASR